MNVLTPAVPECPLPTRLRERLHHLKLCLVTVGPGGHVHPAGPMRWVERLLIDSLAFQRQMASIWARPGGLEPIEVWPGVMLVPLEDRRRRRRPRAAEAVAAALLVGPAFLRADQFHLACGDARMDAGAALGQVDRAMLVNPAEAERLTSLLGWMRDDAAEVDRRVLDLQDMSLELANSYEELSLLYQLAAGMTIDQPPAAFLQHACKELLQVVGLEWLALQVTADEPRLKDLAGELFVAGECPAPSGGMRELGTDLLSRYGRQSRPVVIDDAREADLPRLPQGVTSLLMTPLRREGRVLATLFGGGAGACQVTSREATLCESLSSSLAIFLQNVMFFEDVQAMFVGTLQALTSAIDAKDSYTRGHSDRVANLSRMLAQEAGLPAETCERIYLSGLVHDVGKIGVPEAVLCKTGRLSDEEFGLIKRHPEIGAHILDGIRQMADLVPGVLHHHERWDGRGYPHGLAGEQTPLFGRVIALADAFDAMSSDRTYRRALQPEQVLEEVRCGAGRQFDPELAEAFLRLDLEPYHRLMREHRPRRTAA